MAQNQGDLARTTTHDPNEDWPTYLEIVAYWSKQGGNRRGRRRSITIDADQFFGRGYGAPMSGDQLIRIIEQLRRK